jgi:hypothetical protein
MASLDRRAFIEGGLELKKEILLALGETPLIIGGKLIIKPHEWLVPIEKNYSLIAQEFKRLEPDKIPVNITQNEALSSIITRWQSTVEDVRTIFERLNNMAIYIPRLSR